MRVFVSYAGQDRAWAEWVGWQLEHVGWGLTVELSCWDWPAGANFVERMNRALSTCDRMVALFSRAYFEPARWTTDEWAAAFRRAKDEPGFLIPVRIDDASAPPLLAPLIAPALHERSRDQARQALFEAIRLAGRPDREPPMPGQPMGQDAVAAEPRLPGQLPSVWGQIPGQRRDFTGRADLLVRLRDGLRSSGRPVPHALHGPRGIGKTQLAAEYAWRFANDYDAVWWVDAERVDRIDEQYAAFAVALSRVDRETPFNAAVDELRAYCRAHERWLVVLDNAKDDSILQRWQLAGRGHMLITSRNPYWHEVATPVPVPTFTRPESVALLHFHIPDLSDADAQKIADYCEGSPLRLRASWVRTQRQRRTLRSFATDLYIRLGSGAHFAGLVLVWLSGMAAVGSGWLDFGPGLLPLAVLPYTVGVIGSWLLSRRKPGGSAPNKRDGHVWMRDAP